MTTVLKAAKSFMLEAGINSSPRISGASLKTFRTEQTSGMEAREQTRREEEAAAKIVRVWTSYLTRRRLYLAIRKGRVRGIIRSICIYSLFLLVFSFASVLVIQDQMIYHLGSNIRGQYTATEFEDEDTFVLKTFNDGLCSLLVSSCEPCQLKILPFFSFHGERILSVDEGLVSADALYPCYTHWECF